MPTTNGSAEQKTRLKLDETNSTGANIVSRAERIQQLSGDDATIVAQVTIIKDAIIAIDAQAAIIYTPLQINPLA